jgi:hypothetical protein
MAEAITSHDPNLYRLRHYFRMSARRFIFMAERNVGNDVKEKGLELGNYLRI